MNYPKDQVVSEISKICSSLKTKEKDFQVIAPMYDGDLGINNLNKNLRSVLNVEFIADKSNKLKTGVIDLYEGDRIMITKNDYDRMIFNGETGKIQRINIKQDEVEVKIFNWFDYESSIPKYIDKIFTYKIEEAKQLLKVAYAVSCHRYQGNETDYVLLPMTMQYSIMLYKNLLYTALTRAKKKVFIIGDLKAFSFAIQNDREVVRNSQLNKLITDGLCNENN